MYLLPKPKTIKEQDGQMLLCYSTHIVMTKEVAETEMHAAKRLQGDQAGNRAYPAVFRRGSKEGDLSLGIAKTLPEQTYEITIDEKRRTDFRRRQGLACFMVWRPSARSYSSVAGYCPVYRFRMPRICQTVVIILTRQRGRVLKLEELKKLQTGCAAIN